MTGGCQLTEVKSLVKENKQTVKVTREKMEYRGKVRENGQETSSEKVEGKEKIAQILRSSRQGVKIPPVTIKEQQKHINQKPLTEGSSDQQQNLKRELRLERKETPRFTGDWDQSLQYSGPLIRILRIEGLCLSNAKENGLESRSFNRRLPEKEVEL